MDYRLADYRTKSFVLDKDASSMLYEVKRTRAVWDPTLAVPGTERRGGWRCPVGTRYGGEITDRFGRNCGWGVVRRLGMGITKLGENLENIAERRRQGRVARRNERMLKFLAENGSDTISDALKKLSETIKNDRRNRNKRGAVRAASDVTEQVESARGALSELDLPNMTDEDLDKTAGELTLLENEIRDLVDIMNGEGDNDGAEKLSAKLKEIETESEKITKAKNRRIRGESRRTRSPQVVEERDKIEDELTDTVSKTPVPKGDPKPGETLAEYKKRKYNEHQARVRKMREEGQDAGFLKYNEWDRFHGPVVEENWKKFNKDAAVAEKKPAKKVRRAAEQVAKDKTKPAAPGFRVDAGSVDLEASDEELQNQLARLDEALKNNPTPRQRKLIKDRQDEINRERWRRLKLAAPSEKPVVQQENTLEKRKNEIGEQVAMQVFPQRPNSPELWDINLLKRDLQDAGAIGSPIGIDIDEAGNPINIDDLKKLPSAKRKEIAEKARQIAVALNWQRVLLNGELQNLGRDFMNPDDPMLKEIPDEITKFEADLFKEAHRYWGIAEQLLDVKSTHDIPVSASQIAEVINDADIPITGPRDLLIPGRLQGRGRIFQPIDSAEEAHIRADIFDGAADWYRDAELYNMRPLDLKAAIDDKDGPMIHPHFATGTRGMDYQYKDVVQLRDNLRDMLAGTGKFEKYGPRKYFKVNGGNEEYNAETMLARVEEILDAENEWRDMIHAHLSAREQLENGDFDAMRIDAVARAWADVDDADGKFFADAFPVGVKINTGEKADVLPLEFDFANHPVDRESRGRLLNDVMNNLVAAGVFGDADELIGDNQLVAIMHVKNGRARVIVGRRKFMTSSVPERAFGKNIENDADFHVVGRLGTGHSSWIPGGEVIPKTTPKRHPIFNARSRIKDLLQDPKREKQLVELDAKLIDEIHKAAGGEVADKAVLDEADRLVNDENIIAAIREAAILGEIRRQILKGNDVDVEKIAAAIDEDVAEGVALAASQARQDMGAMRMRRRRRFRGEQMGLEEQKAAAIDMLFAMRALGAADDGGKKAAQINEELAKLTNENPDIQPDWNIDDKLARVKRYYRSLLMNKEKRRVLRELDQLPENQSSIQFVDDIKAKKAADAVGRLRAALKKGEKAGWRDIDKILDKYFRDYVSERADQNPLADFIKVYTEEELKKMSLDELLKHRDVIRDGIGGDTFDLRILDALDRIRKAKTNSKEDRDIRRKALKELANMQKAQSQYQKYRKLIAEAAVREKPQNLGLEAVRLDVAQQIEELRNLPNDQKVGNFATKIRDMFRQVADQGFIPDGELDKPEEDLHAAAIRELIADTDSIRGFQKEEKRKELLYELDYALQEIEKGLKKFKGDVLTVPASLQQEQRNRGIRRGGGAQVDYHPFVLKALRAQEKLDALDDAEKEFEKLPRAKARSLNRPSIVGGDIRRKVGRELRPFGAMKKRDVVGKPLEFDGNFPLPKPNRDFDPNVKSKEDALKYVDDGGSIDKVPHEFWNHVLFNSKRFQVIKDPNGGAIGETHIFILKSDPTKGYVLKGQRPDEQAGEVIGWNLIAAHGFAVDGAVVDGVLPRSGKRGVIIPFAFQDAPAGAVVKKDARGRARNYNVEAIRQRFKDKGVAPRFAGLLHNFLLGVADRHSNNGMAHVVRVNGVDYPYIVPIDQGRAGWDPSGWAEYAGRRYHMDPLGAIKSDIRDALASKDLTDDEKEELKARVVGVFDQFVERSAAIADTPDDELRAHFADIDRAAVDAKIEGARGGNVGGNRYDEIMKIYRRNAKYLKEHRDEILKDLGVL